MNGAAADRYPRIVSSTQTRLSEWATLVENHVIGAAHAAGATYHSILTADYVSILVLTAAERVPLVRQFRPALDRLTLEFPGGLRDSGEEPLDCAIREIAEETGLAVRCAEPLAFFNPDSGRLSNRMWTFFASGATPIPGWQPEEGIECLTVAVDELYDLAFQGEFDHGPHIAMLGMAVMKGLLPPPPGMCRFVSSLA